MAELRGVDCSWYQRGTDWAQVVSDPARRTFAIVKASEGVSYVNEVFASDRRAMADVGLPVRGQYHFSRHGSNSADDEAAHFLRTIGDLAVGELPILDQEPEGGPIDWPWADRFLSIVADALGRAALYSMYAWAIGAPDYMARWPLCVAGYGLDNGTIPPWGADAAGRDTNEVPTPTTKFPVGPWGRDWLLWQYTSNATVPGVPGLCDDSISYDPAERILALAGVTHPAPVPPLEEPMGLDFTVIRIEPGETIPIPCPPPWADGPLPWKAVFISFAASVPTAAHLVRTRIDGSTLGADPGGEVTVPAGRKLSYPMESGDDGITCHNMGTTTIIGCIESSF